MSSLPSQMLAAKQLSWIKYTGLAAVNYFLLHSLGKHSKTLENIYYYLQE